MSKHRDIANQEDVFPWAGFNREFNLANHELKFYMLSMHSPILVYHESLHILVEVSMFGLWLFHFQKWSCLLAVIDISIIFHGLTMDDSWSDYHDFPWVSMNCYWLSIDFYWCSIDVPVIFHDFSMISQDVPWFSTIFQDFSIEHDPLHGDSWLSRGGGVHAAAGELGPADPWRPSQSGAVAMYIICAYQSDSMEIHPTY